MHIKFSTIFKWSIQHMGSGITTIWSQNLSHHLKANPIPTQQSLLIPFTLLAPASGNP